MDTASEKYMIITPNLEPVVYTSVEESGVLLTIRYLCEPYRCRESTQQMGEDILRAFRKCDGIDFAYPTQRFTTTRSRASRGLHRQPLKTL